MLDVSSESIAVDDHHDLMVVGEVEVEKGEKEQIREDADGREKALSARSPEISTLASLKPGSPRENVKVKVGASVIPGSFI